MSLLFSCNDDSITQAPLLLDRTPNSECAFRGYFEGYESKMVAVTTSDCPFTYSSNFLMTFWVPELCNNSTFYEAYYNGIGVAYLPDYRNLNISHDSVVTPFDFGGDMISARQFGHSQSLVITDEFKVRLRIYYDEKFHNAFGNSATEKLVFLKSALMH